MYTFETQIYALGVYWQAEVTYTIDDGGIDVTDIWLLGCYPEGCKATRAVKRNDYDPYRVRADIGYLEPGEYQQIVHHCKWDLATLQNIAPDAAYE